MALELFHLDLLSQRQARTKYFFYFSVSPTCLIYCEALEKVYHYFGLVSGHGIFHQITFWFITVMIKAKYSTTDLTRSNSWIVQRFGETCIKIILCRVIFQDLLPERAVMVKCIMEFFLSLHQGLGNNAFCC